MAASPLSRQAGSALAALGGKGLATYGVGLVRLAVLARLLEPRDFGIFGLALVLLRAADVLTDFGAHRLLIQRRDMDPSMLAGAWLFNVGRGLVMAGAMFGLAPLYAGAVDARESLSVFQVVALSGLFTGLVNPQRYLAERELRFGRIAAYETVGSVVDATVTIVLALWLGDVLALAWGLSAAAGANALMSYLFFPLPGVQRPTWATLRELATAGRSFLVIAVGTFVMTQGDNLVVGKLLGPESLGVYLLAYKLCELPVKVFGKIMNRVALPMFSRLQTEESRRRTLLRQWTQVQLVLLVAAVAVFASLAGPTVRVLYGPTWDAAAPVLTALVGVTVGRGVSHIVAPYILAIGRFSFSASIKVVETLLFMVLVVTATQRYGLAGAAWGSGLAYLVAATMRWVYLIRIGDLGARDSLDTGLRTVLLTALCAGAGAGAGHIAGDGAIFSLASGAVAVGLAWLGGTLLFFPEIPRRLRAIGFRPGQG